MNKRMREQMRALMKLRVNPPIWASLKEEGSSFYRLMFIHPDDWDEAKEKYGDKLERMFDDE